MVSIVGLRRTKPKQRPQRLTERHEHPCRQSHGLRQPAEVYALLSVEQEGLADGKATPKRVQASEASWGSRSPAFQPRGELELRYYVAVLRSCRRWRAEKIYHISGSVVELPLSR